MSEAAKASLVTFGRGGSELTQFEWDRLLGYVAAGKSERTAAGLVGVVFEAVVEREALVPEFRAALADARSRRVGAVEDSLYEVACRGDTRAATWFLRQHDPGRYRRDPEPPVVELRGAQGERPLGRLQIGQRQRQVLERVLREVLGVGPDAPAPREVNPRPRRRAAAQLLEGAALEVSGDG